MTTRSETDSARQALQTVVKAVVRDVADPACDVRFQLVKLRAVCDLVEAELTPQPSPATPSPRPMEAR